MGKVKNFLLWQSTSMRHNTVDSIAVNGVKIRRTAVQSFVPVNSVLLRCYWAESRIRLAVTGTGMTHQSFLPFFQSLFSQLGLINVFITRERIRKQVRYAFASLARRCRAIDRSLSLTTTQYALLSRTERRIWFLNHIRAEKTKFARNLSTSIAGWASVKENGSFFLHARQDNFFTCSKRKLHAVD